LRQPPQGSAAAMVKDRKILIIMKEYGVQIFIAIIAGLLTIVGGIVSVHATKKRDDQTRRLQLKLDHLRSQIQEFYGPLYSLVNQIFIIWDTIEAIRKPKKLPPEDEDRIRKYFLEKHFQPLHQEIRDLIKSKFHLIEDIELPESFVKYLRHSIQEATQAEIWSGLKIDTSFVRGVPWPSKFDDDVKSALNELMKKYDDLLKELDG